MDYSAQETADIVSFIRRNVGDIAKTKIRADEEIFEFINDAADEICRATKCLKQPVYIKLLPDIMRYEEASIVSDISAILQLQNVTVVDADDAVVYELDPQQENQFNASELEDVETLPAIYNLDDTGFRYFKPVSDAGYRAKLDCIRTLLDGERVNYEINPQLPRKYRTFLKYGAMVRAGAAYPEFKVALEYWQSEFMKYTDVQSISKDSKAINYSRKEF